MSRCRSPRSAICKAGQPFYGVKRKFIVDDSDRRGYLKAIDPVTGQAKWKMPFKSPNIAGTLVTAGGLVFTGQLTGEFMAIDIEDGKILWQFQMPSGIVGQPITLGAERQAVRHRHERYRRRLCPQIR